MRSVGRVRRGARRALTCVMIAESGHEHCDGTDGAKFNPLNTTLGQAGSTDFNTIPVQNYATLGSGIQATSATLCEPAYTELRKVLSRQFVSADQALAAWAASPWGPQDAAALSEILHSTYRPNRTYWNQLRVG